MEVLRGNDDLGGPQHVWANRDTFLDRKLSLRYRFGEFQLRVLPVLTFGSSMWIWSRTVANQIYTWENGMLRRMLRSQRAPNETYVAHIQPSTRKARSCYAAWGFTPAAELILKSIYRAADQLQHLPEQPPQEPEKMQSAVLVFSARFCE